MNRGSKVAVRVDPGLSYPQQHDVESYIDRQAPVYRAVAEVLDDLGLPRLRGLVEPGDRVLIKPNWVSERHPGGEEFVFGNITHGAVLAALADMAMQHAGPDGEVIIGEVTTQEANFARMCELCDTWHVAALLEERYGQTLEVMDLRSQVARVRPDGLVTGLREAPGMADEDYPFGDPTGYCALDLGNSSEHAPRDGLAGLLRVTDHTFSQGMKDRQTRETGRHHSPGRHEYLLPLMVLGADVFINVPKFKTHVKAGVTLALKNLIGTNARKALIPHRKAGPTDQGGDEWPDAGQLEGLGAALTPELRANLERVATARDANWFGNDTLWRTILDLNKILRYGSPTEGLCARPQRKYLAVVDGIEGSDGAGPTNGRRRQDGVLVAGTNPVYVDTVAATIMGFDWRALPHIARAYGLDPAVRLVDEGPEAIEVVARPQHLAAWRSLTRQASLGYAAAPGWITRVELP
ncbi:MAG: DUF362 domain-containing protein [Bacillota bacterium]|nr:DUF362 domain-containing protein [Bacillota bacterium]